MNFQELGQLLREERERRGLTLDDVMELTKISRTNLEALENGDSQGLPHVVYAKGFIRSYARVLRLDVEELMTAVDAEVNSACPDSADQYPRPVLSSSPTIRENAGCADKGRSSTGRWLLLLLLLAVVALGAFLFYQKLADRPATPPVAEQAAPQADEAVAPADEAAVPAAPEASGEEGAPEAAAPAETPAETPAVAPETPVVPDQAAEAPAPAAESAPAEETRQVSDAEDGAPGITYEHNLVIRATTDKGCWIGVWRGDEEKMYRNYVLSKGEPLNLMFNTPRRIRIGNVAGVEVTYNGKPYSLDGAKGNITTLRFGMDQ